MDMQQLTGSEGSRLCHLPSSAETTLCRFGGSEPCLDHVDRRIDRGVTPVATEPAGLAWCIKREDNERKEHEMRTRTSVFTCLVIATLLTMEAGATDGAVTTAPTQANSPVATPAGCPVTEPNGAQPPLEAHVAGRGPGGHGSEALWTNLWAWGEGVVLVPPTHVQADGSLGPMKWPWWRGVPGQLVIKGRRLDAPAPPLQASMGEVRIDQPLPTPSGFEVVYTETAFHPIGLVFPTTGCWEITGGVGEERLTFVTLVVLAEDAPDATSAEAADR